jgi:hypothetical protein
MLNNRLVGSFLLVHLHMISLLEKYDRDGIRKALSELPAGVNDTYKEALNRIEDVHKQLAYRIFSWLIYSYRPLSLTELQHALAVREGSTEFNDETLPDTHFITSVCVGLVELSPLEVEGSPEESRLVTFVRRYRIISIQ